MTSTIKRFPWHVELWQEVRSEYDSDSVLVATYDFDSREEAEAFADGLPGAAVVED